MKESGGPGKNHRSVISHRQTLSHNVVDLTLIEIRAHNISGDRHRLHWWLLIQLPYDNGNDGPICTQEQLVVYF